MPVGAQAVFDARRHFGVNSAFDDVVGFQRAQLRGQCALRHRGQDAADFIEAQHAVAVQKAAGATQTSQILYGYWPAVKPAFWSIMLLRWDINVRESSVLGLVGAGGIGMIMNSAIDLFEWDRVAVILLTIFAVVVIAEIVITYFRRRLL